MNNADVIVRALHAAGIRHCFGVPSGNVIPLMDAMRRGGIDFVLTAHEGSAGFAADVMARLSGTPGFCAATLGPGATNLATGVGNAWLDRSPLIAVTCNLPSSQIGRRMQMWIDHQALFKPITKASIMLRPGEVMSAVREALTIALSEPAGPVHLDLPEDVAVAAAADEPAEPPSPSRRPPPPAPAIRHAAGILASSQRPIAVIGANARRMQSVELLHRFVHHHRLPFFTTTMAKGLIDEDDELCLGCIERARRQVQRAFLRRADLIVGIGYDTVEVEYEAWAQGVGILHVDIEPADVDATVDMQAELVGDLDAAVTALLAAAARPPAWNGEELREHRRQFRQSLRPSGAVRADPSRRLAAGSMSPHIAIDVVRDVLPRDGILAFDVGAHTHQIASQWTAHAARSFLITNGWSSMGFGLPAAIAAKIARPDAAVVCIVGDGCFQMTCGELAVARRLGLSIPFVVLVDHCLSLIKVKQERRNVPVYGTRLQDDRELEAVWPAPPAHYFGVPACGAASPAELARLLQRAFAAPGPTVIEAAVDADGYLETVYD